MCMVLDKYGGRRSGNKDLSKCGTWQVIGQHAGLACNRLMWEETLPLEWFSHEIDDLTFKEIKQSRVYNFYSSLFTDDWLIVIYSQVLSHDNPPCTQQNHPQPPTLCVGSLGCDSLSSLTILLASLVVVWCVYNNSDVRIPQSLIFLFEESIIKKELVYFTYLMAIKIFFSYWQCHFVRIYRTIVSYDFVLVLYGIKTIRAWW